MKNKKWLILIIIAIVIVSLTIGFSYAYFTTKSSATAEIQLSKGIKLQNTGLNEVDGKFYLVANKTFLDETASLSLNEVKLKVFSSDYSDVYIRIQFVYEIIHNSIVTVMTKDEICPEFFSALPSFTNDWNEAEDGWFYYGTKSAEGLQVLGASSFVNVIMNPDNKITLSEDFDPDAEIDQIKIVLKIEAIQADQTAFNQYWNNL